MKKKKIVLLVIFLVFLLLVTIGVIFILNKDDNKSLNNKDNRFSEVEGVWVADKTQYIYILGYEDGEPIYSNADIPFYLTLDGEGKYKLEMSETTETGTYSLNGDSLVLQNEEKLITETCRIKNKEELHCDKYAYLYVNVRQ